jgi:hypothetical protein
VLPGEPVEVHASEDCEVEVVRDGLNPTVVHRGQGPGPVASQATGMHIVRTRALRDAEWSPPTAWFVVRSPEPSARGILLVLATNTWNAYNDTGGANLYTGAVELSFARPLAAGMLAKPRGAGERLIDARAYLEYTAEHRFSPWHAMAGWAGAERHFVVWAEREGIDLSYATNLDLETVDGLLDDQRLVLSVGHDEYWTWGMRDALEGFIAGGGNVAFLSGNTCYWQVRVEDRRMIAWKHRFAEDPVQGERTTTMWADPLVGRPEAALTGVSFTRGGYHRVHKSVPRGTGAYEVHRPDHWLFEGTRLKRGDLLGAAGQPVGYECDGCDLALDDGLPIATGAGGTPPGFVVVATAPATPFDSRTTPLPLAPGGRYELEFHAERLLGGSSPENCDRLRSGHAVLGTYNRGGTVVTVGCTDWAFALDDADVAQVTRNVLYQLTRLQ